MSRVAVCLSGYPRTWRHCVESQLRYFPGADFFLHTWRDGHDVMAPRDWTFDEINVAYKPRGISTDLRPDYSWFEREVHARFDVARSSANMMYIAHGIYDANCLREAEERRRGVEYDWVVRARFDCLFRGTFAEVEQTLRPDTLYFPTHANYHGGYNDQVCVADARTMARFARLVHWLKRSLVLSYPHQMYVGELVVKHFVEHENIHVQHRPIDYKILRPSAVGRSYDEIPVNDLEYSRRRNVARVSRARDLSTQ